MPLSKGEVFDNNIRCEYHGMLFDGAGTLRRHSWPNKDTVEAKVRSFPVEERNDLIWIWMGDPEKADIARSSAIHGTTLALQGQKRNSQVQLSAGVGQSA